MATDRKKKLLRGPMCAALALAFCLILVSDALAQDELSADINAALADQRLAGAQAAVSVIATETGRILYRRNAMTPLIPASNQKIITAAVALRELKPDYEFKTCVLASGDVNAKEGVVRGDLVLRGGGDPSLGSPSAKEEPLAQFQRWAATLKERGVMRVTGDLVVDDSFFDRRRVHPDWPREQLGRQYCAPVGALALNDNCVGVVVKPGNAAGEKAIASFLPLCPTLAASVTCTTNGKRNVIVLDRRAGTNVVQIGGSVRLGSQGYTSLVTVPDPALFAGDAFAEVLRQNGIRIEGKVRPAGEEDLAGRKRWRELAVRRTPVKDVLRVMLQESQNMYAETVVKTVGAEQGGEGSWDAGLRCAAGMLRDLHFKDEEFKLADGGGMSRTNRLPPALLCAVLMDMNRSQYKGVLAELLAAPGEEGTLERRFKDPEYARRIRAKTGYLRGVGALSGYVEAKSGLHVTFSILINDFRDPSGNLGMKDVEDRIACAIVDHAR